jgi:hypothetical protein
VDGHIPEEWKCHLCNPRPAGDTLITNSRTGRNQVRTSSTSALVKRRCLQLVNEQEAVETTTPALVSSHAIQDQVGMDAAQSVREHDSRDHKSDDPSGGSKGHGSRREAQLNDSPGMST